MAGPSTSSKKRKPVKRARSKASLKSGRPPLATTATKSPTITNPSSLSSKHTRTLINTHHLLQKRLATARSTGNSQQIQELESALAAQGGLKSYQLASRTGQRNDRGGDSSKVLVGWLDEELKARRNALQRSTMRQGGSGVGDEGRGRPDVKPIRILEVGALSTQNALNIPGVTTVRRIDLRSSEEGIEEIDFMHLPVPGDADGRYDVLSLSLVLNYVPDPKSRGDMLARTTLFFAPTIPPDSNEDHETHTANKNQTFPSLFLVLPGPCLENSRYLTPSRLTSILYSLGYVHLHTKTTRKLYYSLWRYDGARAVDEWVGGGGQRTFRKTEINPGGGRNNFCVVLNGDEVQYGDSLAQVL